MGFSRQEYWSGLPFPSPVDLPDPGIKPGSLVLQAESLLFEPPGKALVMVKYDIKQGAEMSCRSQLDYVSFLSPLAGHANQE